MSKLIQGSQAWGAARGPLARGAVRAKRGVTPPPTRALASRSGHRAGRAHLVERRAEPKHELRRL